MHSRHSERGKLTICKQVAHHELLTPEQWKHNYSCSLSSTHTNTHTHIANNYRLHRLGRSETKIKFSWCLWPEADSDKTWQQNQFGTTVIYEQSLVLLYTGHVLPSHFGLWLPHLLTLFPNLCSPAYLWVELKNRKDAVYHIYSNTLILHTAAILLLHCSYKVRKLFFSPPGN